MFIVPFCTDFCIRKFTSLDFLLLNYLAWTTNVCQSESMLEVKICFLHLGKSTLVMCCKLLHVLIKI
jgi:hypothetical protein